MADITASKIEINVIETETSLHESLHLLQINKGNNTNDDSRAIACPSASEF